MTVSLNGYGENTATFKFTGLVSPNQPVTMAENFTVKPCESGDIFIGSAVNAKGEYACIKLSGYTEFSYSGTAPTVGVCSLAADGNGKVCVSDSGRQYIVVNVNTDNSTVGILL